MKKSIKEDEGSAVGEYDVPLFGKAPVRKEIYQPKKKKAKNVYFTQKQLMEIQKRNGF
jgi:hypothetical protein